MSTQHAEVMRALGQIEADVKHVKKRMDTGAEKFEKHDGRLKSLEGSRNRGRGALAVLATLATALGGERLLNWFSS